MFEHDLLLRLFLSTGFIADIYPPWEAAGVSDLALLARQSQLDVAVAMPNCPYLGRS
jgi:hypothetical protein